MHTIQQKKNSDTMSLSIPLSSTSSHSTNKTSSSPSTSTINSTSNVYNNLLRTLLVLDLVLLDKLHRRSNLSLILIHLRSKLDKFIDDDSNIDVTDGKAIHNLLSDYDNSMKIIFQNSSYYGLVELEQIYSIFYDKIMKDDQVALNSIDFDSLTSQILCCSESLMDYLHFNSNFDEISIKNYESEKLRSHYASKYFGDSTTSTNLKNSTSQICINKENLSIVKSSKFVDFHLKRWKCLNLLDRHIFKS